MLVTAWMRYSSKGFGYPKLCSLCKYQNEKMVSAFMYFSEPQMIMFFDLYKHVKEQWHLQSCPSDIQCYNKNPHLKNWIHRDKVVQHAGNILFPMVQNYHNMWTNMFLLIIHSFFFFFFLVLLFSHIFHFKSNLIVFMPQSCLSFYGDFSFLCVDYYWPEEVLGQKLERKLDVNLVIEIKKWLIIHYII